MATDTALPLTMSMRVYYSTYHLWAAESFTLQAVAREAELLSLAPTFDIQHRAIVTSAIVSSVAFLEAAINETLKDAADRYDPYVGHLREHVLESWAELWDEAEGEGGRRHRGILQKYQEALDRAGVRRFDAGRGPFQDVRLVVRLRNHLMHFKPASRTAADLNQFERSLRSRFVPNALMAASPGNPFFPDHCLSAGCAGWCARTSRLVADEFFGRVAIKPNYQRVNHRPRELPVATGSSNAHEESPRIT